MSDDLTANENEIRRRLVIFLRIPAEVWTDVLKLFPRRTLVQIISPVCYRLKEISNRNVKTIHEIKEAGRFNQKLRQADPESKQQLEHLAGNNCQLASQFRLTRIRIIPENMAAILHHCIDLFRGCRLSFFPYKDEDLTHFNDCLTYLEPAKPVTIHICLYNGPQLLFNQFLRHQTIWNCCRISLSLSVLIQSADAMPIVGPFLDWLHHQPTIGVDGSGDGAEREEVRCLIIQCSYKIYQGAIDWLINGCIQNLQQSHRSKDRRRFVISFVDMSYTTQLDQFERRHHNQMTGEVLLLEPDDAVNQIVMVYRLRRCLAEEADNGNELYGKTFKRDRPWDEFVDNKNDGPMVATDFN